jgi:hypothetical protein
MQMPDLSGHGDAKVCRMEYSMGTTLAFLRRQPLRAYLRCARLGRVIIHFDAASSALNSVALKAAKQTLLALKIPVLTGGLDLGDLLPSAAFRLAMKNSLNCFRAPILSVG